MDELQTPDWQENTSNDEKAADADATADTVASGDNTEGSVSESLDEAVPEDTAGESVSEHESAPVPEEQAAADDGKAESFALFMELNEKMDQMNLLFTQKIQHTDFEEKIVDQMHAELQK